MFFTIYAVCVSRQVSHNITIIKSGIIKIDIDILQHVHISRHMDIKDAITMFDALSNETRLRTFRILVEAGTSGLPAGTLSQQLAIPHNTMSFHLNHLTNAKIVNSRKEGRSVIYSTNFESVRTLIQFMIEDCCRSDVVNIRQDEKKGCSIIQLFDCFKDDKNDN